MTLAAAPDIAVGDVLGSCVFNLAMLVVLDFIQRGESVYRRVRQGHLLSAGFGVLLIGFIGISLLLHGQGASFSIGRIGSYTPIIFLLYALAVRAVFTYEREHREEATEAAASRYPELTLRRAALTYIGAAAIIIAAGTALPFVAERLAELMGWHRTFVGTLLVAAVTSLPELIVTHRGVPDRCARHGGGKPARQQPVQHGGARDRRPAVSRRPAAVPGVAGARRLGHVRRDHVRHRDRRDSSTDRRARVFRTVGWTSLALFTMYLLNSYVLYLHGT